MDNEINLIKYFTKKELCYYKMIDKFFRKCPDREIILMIKIINKESSISLRILDWFVTRYSRKGIDLGFSKNNDEEICDVFINYKAQLKSYKKKYFDPFKRHKKFTYTFKLQDQVCKLTTTLGQLNFFKWAITNRIVSYVELELDNIIKAMNSINLTNKNKLPVISNSDDMSSHSSSTSTQSVTIKPGTRVIIKKNNDITIENNNDKDLILEFD